MTVTRRTVLELLGTHTDAQRGRTITVSALASALGVPTEELRAHILALDDCNLAVMESETNVRISLTGEEFLSLGLEECVIIHSDASTETR